MLLVLYSKDHNYFPWHGIALSELCLLGQKEARYTTIRENLATAVAVYLNQA